MSEDSEQRKEKPWVVTFLYSGIGEMNNDVSSKEPLAPSSWSFGEVGVHAEKIEDVYQMAIKKLAHDFQTNPVVDREGCAAKHIKFAPLGIFPTTDEYIDGKEEGFDYEPGNDNDWQPDSIPYKLQHQEGEETDAGTE